MVCTLAASEEFTLVCLHSCVPRWCYVCISCGKTQTPCLHVSLCSLSYDPLCLISKSQELDFWRTQVLLNPRELNISFLFLMSLCRKKELLFFLETYLIPRDGWFHLGGSSALCGIGWGHSGSCVQLRARLGQNSWHVSWAGLSNRLIGFLSWWLKGSKSIQTDCHVLTTSSYVSKCEGNDQWCYRCW